VEIQAVIPLATVALELQVLSLERLLLMQAVVVVLVATTLVTADLVAQAAVVEVKEHQERVLEPMVLLIQVAVVVQEHSLLAVNQGAQVE
jgi:hypothetical protein